jgi:hypothetical protein
MTKNTIQRLEDELHAAQLGMRSAYWQRDRAERGRRKLLDTIRQLERWVVVVFLVGIAIGMLIGRINL